MNYLDTLIIIALAAAVVLTVTFMDRNDGDGV